jgi:RHS repeat-associated protein
MGGHHFGFDARHRRQNRWSALILSSIVAATSAGFVPPESPPGGEGPSIVRPPAADPARVANVGTTILDNFNRTVSSGATWGTSSSGALWQSFSCQGYTAAVDGQSGRLTGSAGANCGDDTSPFRQLTNPAAPGLRSWDAPSWAFTATFKTSAVDGSLADFAVTAPFVNNTIARVALEFGGGGGWVSLISGGTVQAPFSWQADTWYSVKWAVIWGDQTRVKIWPTSAPEPADWLLALSGTMPTQAGSPFIVEWFSTFGPTSLFVDDFAFGPAPILPKLPPPPGTENNPPYLNQQAGGDPVSTYTGTFSDLHLDTAMPGRGPSIEFARSYNSNDTRVSTLGPAWTHSYNIRLVSPDDGTEDIILMGPQGRSDRYVDSGGTFTAPLGVHRTLVRNADDTYTATDKSQTEWRFDPTGSLTQIRDRFGNASNLVYNASGQLSTIGDPAGRGVMTLGYTSGRLTSVTDWLPVPRVVTYQYDASGRLWKVTDREGKTTTFAYDGTSHRIATITNARGYVTLTLTYDAQGRVATQKDARGLVTGDVTTFGYVVNPDGTRVTTITAPVTSFEPSFNPTSEDTYGASGWLTQRVLRPSSTETLTQSFTYDGAGNRTSVTDARGNRTDVCYDVDYAGAPIAGSAANPTRMVGPAPTLGANRPVTLLGYDAKYNLIQQVSPKGVPSGPTVTCATDLSAVNSTYAADFGYDAGGVKLLSQTTRFTDPDTGPKTAVTKYEYGDSLNPGLVTRTIPPRGNTTPTPDYTYATTITYFTTGDKAGLLQDVTDPLGNKTSFGYTFAGRLGTITDQLGNAPGGSPTQHFTAFAYDKEDRLQLQQLPPPKPGDPAPRSETRYDEVGNPAVRIDFNGQVTTSTFDGRNSLSQVKESAATWTDPASPPAAVITTEYSYDAAPQAAVNDVLTNDQTQPSIVIGASGAVHALWADARSGNADVYYSKRDPWTGLWTASVRVNDVTTNAQNQPAITVDTAGNVYAIWTDARAGAADDDIYYSKRAVATGTWSASVKVNDDGTGKRQYDPALAISTTGELIAAWYDQRGGGTKRHIYSARLLANGSIWSANLKVTSDASAVKAEPEVAIGADGTTYAVWRDHRSGNADVWFATLPLGGSAWSANTKVSDDPGTAAITAPDIGVDTAGNLLVVWSDSRTSPSQIRSRRRPAGSGTWSASVVVGGSTANTPAVIVRPDGRAFTSWFNGTPGTLTTLWGSEYDPSTLTWTVPEQLTAAGEEAANPSVAYSTMEIVVTYQRRPSGGNYDIYSRRKPLDADQFVYGLDRLYRLTSVAGPDGARAYTYDPVGNRLSRVSGGTTAYTYDRADRINTAGSTSITVDANGNLTAKGADTFAFDQANRLTSATTGGISEAYVYDGDGTRFSRQVGAGPAIRFVSDVAAGLPLTIDDGTRKYVYGVGLAYAVSGSAVDVYHNDRLGSVRGLTNLSGSITASYRLDEWGLPTASSGGSSQPLGFTGEPRDGTGLTYLRARYYDADLGRFTSRDTWPGSSRVSQTLNRFAYANGNPVTNSDPSGHFIDTFVDGFFIVVDGFALVFGPEKDRGMNALALAADVTLLFVPFATGGGLAVRSGGKVADDGIHLIDDAAGAACSFTGETLVATPDGLVPISEIELGDIVLAWDEASGQVVERRVTAVLRHPDDQIARITIDGVSVTTTPDHPFLTIERGWVEAGLLWPGAHLKTTIGFGTVASVEFEAYSGALWNLTVDGAHTFFVGPGSALAHNSCPISGPPTIDASGKVHGDLPGFPPPNWTREQLGELAADLRVSILRRKDELIQLGEHGPHRARIGEEEQLLRQIEKALSGS